MGKISLVPHGLDERPNPDPGSASKLVNMSWIDGVWRAAPGRQEILATGDPVVSLGWADLRMTGPTLLVETGDPSGGGALYRLDMGTLDLEPLALHRTIVDGPWGRTQFLAAAGWALFCNGFDGFQRTDGVRVRPVGFDQAPAPAVLIDPGKLTETVDSASKGASPTDFGSVYQRGLGLRPDTAQPEAWRYGWRIVWEDDLGMRSPASAFAWLQAANPSNGAFAADSYRLSVLLTLPPPPPQVRRVHVYRTGNVSTLSSAITSLPTYHVATLSPGETSFTDDFIDPSLGALLDESQLGPVPPRVARACFFKGRLYTLSQNDPVVRYSAPLFWGQFPPDNTLLLGQRDAVMPTGMFATRDCLVIFKPRGIWLITDDGTIPQVAQLTEDVGCVAGDALAEVPGAGLLFLAAEGPYLLEGATQLSPPTGLRPLYGNLRKTWARVNQAMLGVACCSIVRRERAVWFLLPRLGSTRPDLGLQYHYGSGEWSELVGYDSRCMVETRDAQAELFQGTGAGIYRVTRFVAPASALEYRLAPVRTADRRQLITSYVWTLSAGRHTLSASRYEARYGIAISTQQAALRDAERPKGTQAPAWDSAAWSATDLWADDYPVQTVADLWGRRSHEYEVGFTGDDLQLVGIDLEFEGEEGPDIPKLSTRT